MSANQTHWPGCRRPGGPWATSATSTSSFLLGGLCQCPCSFLVIWSPVQSRCRHPNSPYTFMLMPPAPPPTQTARPGFWFLPLQRPNTSFTIILKEYDQHFWCEDSGNAMTQKKLPLTHCPKRLRSASILDFQRRSRVFLGLTAAESPTLPPCSDSLWVSNPACKCHQQWEMVRSPSLEIC